MNPLRIGIIGLDISHVTAFATLLHDPKNHYHVPGARIVAGFPGGSPDFPLSINRVKNFTEELRTQHQVEIVQQIEQLRPLCDAILIESVDGRVHLEQFTKVADWNMPVFIDKPLTISSVEAQAIFSLAKKLNTRVMTSSPLRFADDFQKALNRSNSGIVCGSDFFGPVPLEEVLPGFFWYGIHTIEMLYAAMGTGCLEVTAERNGPLDWVVGRWPDQRLGTLRGTRSGSFDFGGIIHRESGSTPFKVSDKGKPFYACLLEEIMRFFKGDPSPVLLAESVEIIRFIEAANESIQTGKTVKL
ncbi:MAG: Gfo/Idh/MocA family oxidoreductase [Verrucomicrobiota bacterium]